MILLTGEGRGLDRIAHLDNVFRGATVILMGGAPTITTQPLHLLEARGVVSAAINNAARHFRPTIWFSGDHPGSFEPQIIEDPGIMKFAPHSHTTTQLRGRPYHERANLYLYVQDRDVPMGEFLCMRRDVPWYYNTMFVSLHILTSLGFKRIILGGSDFHPDGKQMYAHDTKLNQKEHDMNIRLYTKLVDELKLCKPVFEKAEVEFMDCSVRSKLADTYEHITMEKAIELCRENFPTEMLPSTELPHGTRFASEALRSKLNLSGTLPEQEEANNDEMAAGLDPEMVFEPPVDSSPPGGEMEEVM